MVVIRTENFLSQLKTKRKVKDIKKLCEDELAYLRENLNSTASLKTYVSEYRNEIRNYDSDNEALRFFKITKEELADVQKKTNSNMVKEHRGLRELDKEKFISKCTELVESISYSELTIGLCGLTGRRIFEILVTGIFEEVEEEKFLLFSGQAKTKKSESAKTYPYVIPILGDPCFILERFKFLRSIKSFPSLEYKVSHNQDYRKEYKAFHNQVSANLGRVMKKQFEGIIEAPKPKDLRSAYAEISCSFFNSDSMSNTAFFADVLGHSKDDIQTAQSYEDFFLV